MNHTHEIPLSVLNYNIHHVDYQPIQRPKLDWWTTCGGILIPNHIFQHVAQVGLSLDYLVKGVTSNSFRTLARLLVLHARSDLNHAGEIRCRRPVLKYVNIQHMGVNSPAS